MPYTDDPVADFLNYDAEQTKALESRPQCAYCDQYIQDNVLYDFDGELICPECLEDYINDNFKKDTSDYID